ncbi:hypothetical protein XENTR_v10013824 [Xenopus tropicalis]|nr:hypothetical protein XENTR_v10013824 [Xenopus tropicalis]
MFLLETDFCHLRKLGIIGSLMECISVPWACTDWRSDPLWKADAWGTGVWWSTYFELMSSSNRRPQNSLVYFFHDTVYFCYIRGKVKKKSWAVGKQKN